MHTWVLAVLATLVALLACSDGTAPVVEPSGFLGDYSGFGPHPNGTNAPYYRKPGLDLARYGRVIVDPVEVALAPEAAGGPVDPAELTALAEYMHGALLIALRDAYPVVEEPAPDVLRLRVGITDVVALLQTAVGLRQIAWTDPTSRCASIPGDYSPGSLDEDTFPPTWTPTGDTSIGITDVIVLLRAAVSLLQVADTAVVSGQTSQRSFTGQIFDGLS